MGWTGCIALHESRKRYEKREQCMCAGETGWLDCETTTVQPCCASFGPAFFFKSTAHWLLFTIMNVQIDQLLWHYRAYWKREMKQPCQGYSHLFFEERKVPTALVLRLAGSDRLFQTWAQHCHARGSKMLLSRLWSKLRSPLFSSDHFALHICAH